MKVTSCPAQIIFTVDQCISDYEEKLDTYSFIHFRRLRYHKECRKECGCAAQPLRVGTLGKEVLYPCSLGTLDLEISKM